MFPIPESGGFPDPDHLPIQPETALAGAGKPSERMLVGWDLPSGDLEFRLQRLIVQ